MFPPLPERRAPPEPITPSSTRAVARPDPTGRAAPLTVRSWIVLAAAWSAAAAALAASAALGVATGLIFHFHPVGVALGSAWLYRRLEGARPCPTRSITFLLGLVVVLSATDEALRARGLADAPGLAAAIGLAGLAGASWLLLRADPLAPFRTRAR